jgi:hypothetical protein
MERLRRESRLSLASMIGDRPVLDIGTADGALAFLFESLGYAVHACVLASLRTGAQVSDPSTGAGDERQFLLLESSRLSA